MADPLAGAVETFAAPIEDLIVALGQGLAEAQRQLDQNSIATQEAIDSDPALSNYGLQAPWYQFPSITLNLKLAISVSQAPTPAQLSPGVALAAPTRVFVHPLSPGFQTHFNYDATAASEVNVTIAPVPAPRTGTLAAARLTAAQVTSAALASPAKFITATDSSGQRVPATADSQGDVLRLDVNFNPSAGVWYVLQSAPAAPAFQPIVVAVDDATGAVRVITSP
jgi:hypothetical protein